MNSETAVGEVGRSFPLQPIPDRLSSPLREVHVPLASSGIVGVSVQSDEQGAGNRQVVLDFVHLALAIRSERGLAGIEFDAPVALRNHRAGISARMEAANIGFGTCLRVHRGRSENIRTIQNL